MPRSQGKNTTHGRGQRLRTGNWPPISLNTSWKLVKLDAGLPYRLRNLSGDARHIKQRSHGPRHRRPNAFLLSRGLKEKFVKLLAYIHTLNDGHSTHLAVIGNAARPEEINR